MIILKCTAYCTNSCPNVWIPEMSEPPKPLFLSSFVNLVYLSLKKDVFYQNCFSFPLFYKFCLFLPVLLYRSPRNAYLWRNVFSIILLLFQLQLSAFTAVEKLLNKPSPPPCPASTPPWFCPSVLYNCSWKPFPLSPLIILSHLPSDYYQIVLNFYVSGYISLAFFLLLIMFQLKMRSYGICPSLPGLFHLT